MSNDMYYALTVSAQGTDRSAFCSLTPLPPLEFLQGGWTLYPTATAMTSVTIYPQTVQMQWPPSESINGGVTIVTDAPIISGNLVISPPLNVPVVVTLYGVGGKPIADAAIEPGHTEVAFSWAVKGSDSISEQEAEAILQEIASRRL